MAVANVAMQRGFSGPTRPFVVPSTPRRTTGRRRSDVLHAGFIPVAGATGSLVGSILKWSSVGYNELWLVCRYVSARHELMGRTAGHIMLAWAWDEHSVDNW